MPVIGFLDAPSLRPYAPICGRVPPGPERSRLCRGPERRDRISLGGGSIRSTAGTGGRSGPPSGGRDRCDRRPPLALAAKAATTTIPIVFTTGGDPVKAASSPASTGRAATSPGVSLFTCSLAAKRLELLRELVPEPTSIAVLVNPSNPRYRDLNEATCRRRRARSG